MATPQPGVPGQPNGPTPASAPPQAGQPIYPGTPVYPGLPPIPPFALPQATDLPSFPGAPAPPAPPARGASAKPWLIVLIAVTVATVIFGGIYALDRAFSPPDLTGTWSVSLTSSTGTQTGTMTLTQIGSEVTGTATLSASGLPGTSTVSGSASGRSFNLDVFASSDFLVLNGSFVDGSHLSGTYTALVLDGSPSDIGSWSATRTA